MADPSGKQTHLASECPPGDSSVDRGSDFACSSSSAVCPDGKTPGRRQPSVFKLSASTTPLGRVPLFPPAEEPLRFAYSGVSASPFHDSSRTLGSQRVDSSFASEKLATPCGAPASSRSFFASERGVRFVVNPYASEEQASPERQGRHLCSSGVFPGVGAEAEKRQADAEIAQLAIRETEEGAPSAFVLRNVVERNVSSDSLGDPSAATPARAGAAVTDSLSASSGGPQGELPSSLPSYAAVEAPYGFPMPVHRSLCSGRNGFEGDDSLRRTVGVSPPPVEARDKRTLRMHDDSGFLGGCQLSEKAREEIEDHNLQLLSRMHPHEIREAQEEILQRFGTKRFEALRRRALRRAQAAQRDERRVALGGDYSRDAGNQGAANGSAASGVTTLCPEGVVPVKTATEDPHGTANPSTGSPSSGLCVSPSSGSSPVSSPPPSASSSASFALPGGGKCILEWSVDPRVLSEEAGVPQGLQSPARAFPHARVGDLQMDKKIDDSWKTRDAWRQTPEPVMSDCSRGQGDVKPRGVKSSVRFDIQEAAKLQWANPLDVEDARGGPVEEADEEEWDAAEVKAIVTGSARPGKTGKRRRIRIEKLRFDFDGKLRSQMFVFQALWDAIRLLQQVDGKSLSSESFPLRSLHELVPEDPLEFHRGLHHHSDEAALPGYTLGELFQLAQSASRPQAALAVRTLGAVLRQSRVLFSVSRRIDTLLCGHASEVSSVLSSLYLGGTAEQKGETGDSFSLLRPFDLSDSTVVSAFGLGFRRWRRFVFRDLFLCWRLASLLQQQTPATHRAALVALDAALAVPTRDEVVGLDDACRLGDTAAGMGEGDEEGQGDTEEGERERNHDGEGPFWWRGVAWGGGWSFPFFLEPSRKNSTCRVAGKSSDGAKSTDHPTPLLVPRGATEAFAIGCLNHGGGQMVATRSGHPAARCVSANEAANGGTGKDHNEAQEISFSTFSPPRGDETTDTEKARLERVCLYGLGGFDLVEEGDSGFPLLSFAGPGGGEEERSGCGGACTFWQALSLRVRAQQKALGCVEVEDTNEQRPRRVKFSAAEGASAGEATPASDDEEDVSIAELFFRHPISSLLTYSHLLDRLSFFLSTYEGDEEIERSCLRLLLPCSLLGPSAVDQIVFHPILSQRLQHLAQSLVVGSSARGVRIQRQRVTLFSSAKDCDITVGNASQHVTAGDVYRQLLSAKKAEAAALAERCGTPLSSAERRVLLDLLRLLRCFARWGTVRPHDGEDNADAENTLWGEMSSAFWALINQSMMEGVSVIPRIDGKEPKCDERDEQQSESAVRSIHDNASQATISCPAPSSVAFPTEVQQLLAAAEALRVMRVAVYRNGRPDEFASFYPVLATYVHQFATCLQQLYGESILLRLLLDATPSPLPLQGKDDGIASDELLRPAAAPPLDNSLTYSFSHGSHTSESKPSRQLAALGRQMEAVWTFHGSVTREIFLWATLSLEKRRRVRWDEPEGPARTGMEGASLLGPVPVLLRLFWQLKPHTSSVPSLASFRVVQSALQLASTSTSLVIRSLLPLSRENATVGAPAGAPLRGANQDQSRAKACKHGDSSALPPSVTAGATYGCVETLTAAKYSTKKDDVELRLSSNGRKMECASASVSTGTQEELPGDARQDAGSFIGERKSSGRKQVGRMAWTRDEELLFFRWLRSSRPVLDALLCDTREEECGLACSPRKGVEDIWNSSCLSSGVPCIQIMKQLALKLDGNKNGTDLAASVAAYAIESGWSSGIRCCCHRQGGGKNATPMGTLQTETSLGKEPAESTVVVGQGASACWRGVIPATSENFASLPSERELAFLARLQCGVGVTQTLRSSVDDETAKKAATEKRTSVFSSPCSCPKKAPSRSGLSYNLSCIANECSEHGCPSFDQTRKEHRKPNPRNALPHEIEGILTEARFLITVSDFLTMAIYLARQASTSAVAVARCAPAGPNNPNGDVIGEVFSTKLLLSLGISAASLCRSLKVFLLALFRCLRWPEPLMGHRGILDACRSFSTVRSDTIGTSECQCRVTASGSSSASSAASPSSSPAPPPLRSHEASACSGPLLLFDVLARLMLTLLGLRRVCITTASARKRGEKRQDDIRERSYRHAQWDAYEEQDCLLAAVSAASTSHTFLKCVVSLYSNTSLAMNTWKRHEKPKPSKLSLSCGVERQTSTRARHGKGEKREGGEDEGEQLFRMHGQDDWKQEWLDAATEWFLLCFPPSGSTLQRVDAQREQGRVASNTETPRHRDITFTAVYRSLSAVVAEVEGRRREDEEVDGKAYESTEATPCQERLFPVPLCLLESLDDICSSVFAEPGEDEEAANTEGGERSGDMPQREGATENDSQRRHLASALPCLPPFVSPLDALVGGCLWGSLGLYSSSLRCSGASESHATDTKGLRPDGTDEGNRTYDNAFPLVFILRTAPFLVESLGQYFPPSLIFSSLLLFYTEPSVARGVDGLSHSVSSASYRGPNDRREHEAANQEQDVSLVRPSASSSVSSSTSSSPLSASASAGSCASLAPAGPGRLTLKHLDDLWWLLDAWLLQPLGRASMRGHLSEPYPLHAAPALIPRQEQGKAREATDSTEQKVGGAGGTESDSSKSPQTLGCPKVQIEAQPSLSFSDAFMAIWKAVTTARPEEVEACIDNVVMFALRTEKSVENSSLEKDFARCREGHDGQEGRHSHDDALCKQSNCRYPAVYSNDSGDPRRESLSSTPSVFPLCCAKAHDVLLTRVSRLVLRSQTSEETSDPVLFLLLWLLSFSPAFPVECRRVALSESATLTLADRTFFLSLFGAEARVGDGPKIRNLDDACETRKMTNERVNVQNKKGTQGHYGEKPESREPQEAGANVGRHKSKLWRGHPTWGVVTPHGRGLWGLSEASWWLMRPGGFPPEAREELLTCYRSFLRARLSNGFVFSFDNTPLLSNMPRVNANEDAVGGGQLQRQGLLTIQALAVLVQDEMGTLRRDPPCVALDKARPWRPGVVATHHETSESCRRGMGLTARLTTRDSILRVVKRIMNVLGASSSSGIPECTQAINIDSLVRQLSEAVQGLFGLERICREYGVAPVDPSC
ncbi:RPAP1 family, C-terminal protein [Toxoplasma gondii CAST]|uniref:RPAP1 family, C-terminal protein n=1 Tax=Toxoplasma gondii CAST TaxID=943122 RepID=A0A425HXH1_TOXGO|nr:RPAP1 family, C-terminal protein [Toxoplasma gondii CAST]